MQINIDNHLVELVEEMTRLRERAQIAFTNQNWEHAQELNQKIEITEKAIALNMMWTIEGAKRAAG